MSYCKHKKLKQSAETDELEVKIKALRCSPHLTPAGTTEIKKCELQLDAISQRKLEGIWLDQDPKRSCVMKSSLLSLSMELGAGYLSETPGL